MPAEAEVGAVYVYQRDGTSRWWSQRWKLRPPGDHHHGHFGYSLSMRSNVLAVGAFNVHAVKGELILIGKIEGF